MKLDEMVKLATKGKVNRRDFIQYVVGTGLSVAAAQTMFSSAAAAAPAKGGHFRMGLAHGSTTNTLDPAQYLDNYMGTFGWGTLSNGLTKVDEKGNIGPDLAESFRSSNKSKNWHFKLRKGSTFHNGKSVTAADVIASMQHHMGDDTKSAAKSLMSQVETIESDGDTVEFKLKAGSADFAYILSDYRLPIMPANADGSADWESGIRTGPYMLEKFDPGVEARAKRNPNYFGDAWFDEVSILSIKDTTARTNALISGAVDYIDRCDLKTINFLRKNPKIEVDEITGYGHLVFSMNVTVAPFDNPDVRNAIKYAIDREQIHKLVFAGIGQIGNDNAVAPNVKYAIDPSPKHRYDPEMAKSLLKKAGVSNLEIDLSVSDAAFSGSVDAALIFQQNAAEVGIKINVIREPSDGYWDNVWLKKPFVASFWLGRPTADWVLTFAYAADSSQNETFWKNPRFNELLVSARAEENEDMRAAMYAEAQQLLQDDGGLINILFEKYVSAHSKNVAHGGLLSNTDVDGFKIAERWWSS